MSDLPNPLRDRMEARKKAEAEGTPESIKDRLGKGMGVPAPKSGKNDMLRLFLVGALLLIVVGGMMFVKMYEKKPPSKEETDAARQSLPKIELLPEDQSRWDGFHEKFQDTGDAVDVNSPEFLYFVDRMTRLYTKDKVREMAIADRDQLLARWEKAYNKKAEYPNATLNRMMWDHPNAARGKFFKVSGQLIEIYPEVINTANPNNVKDMWMGIVRDNQTGKPVHFYTAELPKAADGKPFKQKEVHERDIRYKVLDNVYCEIEGIFLKIRPYESMRQTSRGGYVQREAAILIAGSFRELPPPPSPVNVGEYVVKGVALVAIVIGAIVLVTYMLTRKYNKDDDMRIKLGLARMKRARTGGELDWKSIAE
jgi:hypothetical protein